MQPTHEYMGTRGGWGTGDRTRLLVIALPIVGLLIHKMGALGTFLKCYARGQIIVLMDLVLFLQVARVETQPCASHHGCGEKREHPE